MQSITRKRKGTNFSSAIGSHHSDGFDRRKNKKKCSRSGGAAAAAAGIVMTAPPSGWPTAESPGRGLKRKLGCIESATRIGRKKRLEIEYLLGLEIGKGKFGSVRLCRSRATGEEFACKTLLKAGEETAHREVEIMQHLSGHSSIVTLKSVFEDADRYYLVMELCSGGRVLDRMSEGWFSEQQAAILLKDLVSVIKYCHEMGVVHRDIKPENILLTSSGKMKLADFGLAVRVTTGQRLTGVAGSPAYVAPEVLSGHYSEEVDVWSAGVLLHALLVGVLPFRGDSLEAVFEAIKKSELDLHSGTWESVSELARDLVRRMLTRDVSTRITADQILRHPWILLYTESPLRTVSTEPRVGNDSLTPRLGTVRKTKGVLSSLEIPSPKAGEEQDDSAFVDALAVAISRVRISEPKRSRICSPARLEHECSSNTKASLCSAF